MHQHADYVPLHLHTEYSLLDGSIKIDELVQVASEYRMPAVAITDHGNLFGAIEFYKKVSKAGIKPIIGCELYVAPTSRFEKKGSGAGEASFHLILLARDNAGYRNLVNLVTRAYTEGFYYKPRIDKDLLAQYSGGLICLTSCLKGEIPYYLNKDMIDKARQSALEYKHILGPENFFLELQDNGLSAQEKVNKKLVSLADELHIGVVATNDCHYLRKDDARAHDVLLCIQTGKTVHDIDRLRLETEEFYFKSPEDMKNAFKDLPSAIRSTREIAERCNVEFTLGSVLLPTYKTETGLSPEAFLRNLALKGLQEKFGPDPPKLYQERLQTELSIIMKMHYASYFLIVWDFISFARKKGIPVGPGRGSAAGSLVAYCLDITEIDPIRYNLLFERFLNPERISMPDIDVDFCKDKRNEVISYVSEKYGHDHVAQIITFGTMAAKAAIRDVGRALDIPYSEVDKIAKLVPSTLNITIAEALKEEPQLKELYDTNPKVKDVLDIAMRLEGLCRHASTHAAGVVISPDPLTDYTPLYKNPTDGTITTQFDMFAVEDIGLLKFDFLGLKTLTVIEKTIGYIEAEGTGFSLKDIPLEDPDTYRLLSSAQTTGVFQLESSGMRDLLVKMQPSKFEDLIALVSLYRPGPLGSGMVDDFIKRKRGIIPVKYELPQLEEILNETHGVILYQEQVMRIANRLAGFTLGQADILRKAMGKKKPEEMERQKEAFISGASAHGITEKKAQRIYDLMAFFAGYGFNKSHSAAYAYLTYQTAFLKCHFPIAFMAATLSADMDSTEKIVKSISECRSMEINILPPDINESGSEFKVIGNAIRFGLEAVKGVGSAAIESILEMRAKDGPFKSLNEFLQRTDSKKVNRKVIESLVKAGAFDLLGVHRAEGMDLIERPNGLTGAPSLFGQQDFFSSGAKSETEKWNEMELLRYEKEALGFYISGHPLAKYRYSIDSKGSRRIREIEEIPDKHEVQVAGIIGGLKRIKTKGKVETMAYLALEDEEGTMEVLVFPDLYKNVAALLSKERLVMVKGTIDKTEKGVKLIAREVYGLDDYIGQNGYARIEITIPFHLSASDNLKALREIISGNKGKSQVYLKILVNGSQVVLVTSLSVEPSAYLQERIEGLFGKGMVKVG